MRESIDAALAGDSSAKEWVEECIGSKSIIVIDINGQYDVAVLNK